MSHCIKAFVNVSHIFELHNSPFKEADESGGYFIVSAMGERVLDVAEESREDGAAIILWEKHGGDNQIFVVECFD